MCWRPRRTCGDVLCATRQRKLCDVCWRLEVVRYALETLEGMRRMLLCVLEAVGGELCLAEVVEAMPVGCSVHWRMWRVRSVC